MFDYTSNIRSQQTVVCTKDIFDKAISSTKVEQVCRQIALLHVRKQEGKLSDDAFNKQKTELKKRLPAFLFHAHFKDGRRLNSMAEPSGLCIFDIDHIDNPRAEWQAIKPKVKALGIVLVHVTPSCEGLRLVFIMPADTSLKEAQEWLARQLGLADYDASVKDYARCSFAVPERYILYRDDKQLFKPPSTQPCGLPRSLLRRGDVGLPRPLLRRGDGDVHVKHSARDNEGAPSATSASTNQLKNSPPLEGSGEAAGQVAGEAFNLALRAVGLSTADLNNIGSRHNSLLALLSFGITRLMTKEQLKACVEQVAPEYSREADCRQLIDDFYGKYNDPNRPMSRQLQRIYTSSLKHTQQEHAKPSAALLSDDPRFKLNVEAMPRALRDTLITTPENLRLAVLISILPLAASYADGVEFEYLDGTMQKLNLMSFVIGPQASGKSACTRMLKLWLRPMIEADNHERKLEDEWNEKERTRAQGEELPPVPKGPIRFLAVTISNKQFLTRLKNSRGHTLYSMCSELDTLVNSNGAGSWSNKYDIYRYAFDNDVWGMDYSNNETTSQLFPIRYNLSLLGTYGAFRRCFKDDNIENGLSSRVIVAEIPDTAFQPLVPYQKISEVQKQNITDGIVRLMQASGVIDCPRLRQTIAQWLEEKRLEALEEDDLVKDTFRRRAAVIGMRCGVVLRILEGEESDRILSLARLITEYIFAEQVRIFGNQLSKIQDESTIAFYHCSNKRLLASLPKSFTIADVMKAKGSCTIGNARVIVSRWVKNSLVRKTATDQWQRLKG